MNERDNVLDSQQATCEANSSALSRLQVLQRGVWQTAHEVKCNAGAGVRRLVQFVQGGSALLHDQPLWLLGTRYGVTDLQQQQDVMLPEVLEAFEQDFASRVWCTYRKNFPPIGESLLTSDVGWGCTLRSGQMLLAESLSRHMLGRCWHRNPLYLDPRMLALLSMLADNPSAPYSVHRLCFAGVEYGVMPGKWLGPWVLCKTIEALSSRVPLAGLSVHVVCDPSGGGAPALDVQHVRSMLTPTPAPLGTATPNLAAVPVPQAVVRAVSQGPAEKRSGDSKEVREQNVVPPGACEYVQAPASTASEVSASPAPSSLRAGASSESVGMDVLDSTGGQGGGGRPSGDQQGPVLCEPGSCHASAAYQGQELTQGQQGEGHEAKQGHGSHSRGKQHEAGIEQRSSLLLLVPLTLGVDKANPLYYPQLQEVMTYPQTVGIVGGRPSSSLYFLGFQGQQLLYLDPHHVQPSAPLPDASSSYFCDSVQLMPISSMDPSIAIGFYCQCTDDLEDLTSRLVQLAATHKAAPLMTVDLCNCSTRPASDAQMMSVHGLSPGSERLGLPDEALERHEGWELL